MTSATAPCLPTTPSWSDSLTGRFLETLFAAYYDESVRYVVLRNYERWPEDFGKDIDLVVHPNDLALSHGIIRRLAKDLGLTWTVRIKRSGHHTYYLLPQADGVARGILIDIRPSLVHHGLLYLPGTLVLEGRRREGRFFVPSAALESLGILLHCVIDVGMIRASYRERLRTLGVGDRHEFEAAASQIFGARLAHRLAECLVAGDPARALRLRRRLLLATVRRNPRALGTYAYARGGAAMDRVRHFLRPPGQIVILVGPDGSGKTTLSTEIVRRFAATRIPASAVYLGAQKPLLPTRKLSQVVRRALRKEKGIERPIKDVGRKQHLRGLVHIMADKWLRYLVYVRPRLVRGEVVVLDRYFYDLRVYAHPLVQHPLVESLIMHCIPEPSLAFCLKADPAVIAARKNELTTAETARQLALYGGISRWVRNFHEAPSDGHLPTVIDWMSQLVARAYAAPRAPEKV